MPAYSATSRKSIRAAEKAAALLEENHRNFIIGAMSIPQGRSFFYHELAACHIFSDPFTGDALREAYSKGERNRGLRLYATILEAAPDQYITMIKEENVRVAALATRFDGAEFDPNRDPDDSDSADADGNA